ncbi:hypothetical protein [Streptomyces mirabilis]|uniref:hypothetical protein n=1 Tax=Streptomyces mirabilis TaxID=68239 RepID=UPI0036A00026
MTADAPGPRRDFEDVVLARTESDFVERRWLYDEIDGALESEQGQYVLVTGEPGAGKTSLLAGIARARPDRLRYFFRRDSRTAVTGGDTESFLMSIGHQLARTRPELFELERLSIVVQQHIDSVQATGRVIGIKIDDLKVSPFHRTALEVEQRVGDLEGELSGVEIGTAHLEPRLLDPDNLAHLALIGPAQVLAEQDPEARIVILLDALDEIADDHTIDPRKGLLHWLTRSPELPANVKVVMTSRPHAGLRLFRSARAERLTDVVIDAASPQVVGDLHTYADLVLERQVVLEAERARGSLPGSTKRHAVRRAAGNFLYLATYARALIDAAQERNDELIRGLLDFQGVPGQLPSLYGFFVELVRKELTPRQRDGAGEPAGSWEGVGLPIIGVLTVAREALTGEQLAAMSATRLRDRPVQKVLKSLRWLLERRSDRFAFFHASISEFLTGPQAHKEHPECWVDETRWHEQIARHYRGTAPDWADVDWSQVDPYGLSHLAVHVLNSGPSASSEAAGLVCAGLRRAIRTRFHAERRFLELIDSIAHHIADTAPVATGLPAMTYLGVVRHQAAQSSGALPPRAIGLLARVGRVREALEHANGIGPSLWRVMSFVEILRYASPGPDTPSVDELLDMVVESAVSVPGTADRLGNLDVRRAIKVAARLLAPHDVERALRLWQYGQETMPHANGSVDEPDEVYRAAAVAAAEKDVDRARALIDMISGERWADYLDLAERADPERAVELLREAEAALESVGPEVRLLGLARLAAAWATYEPATSRALLAEVRAQVFVAGRDNKLAVQLVKAAELLADVDRTTARFLLARLDTDARGALLGGVALWTRWESPERARALLDRYQAKTHGHWVRLDAMKALGQSNRAEELRLVERVHAATPGPSVDPRANSDRSSGRDDDLVGVVRRMAEYDLARAARMAREVQRTGWSDHWGDEWSRGGDARTETEDAAREVYGSDRYSLLAGIAHLHVARGQTAEAATILEDLLRSVADPAPLRGGGGKGEILASAVPESSEPPARNHVEEVNLMGITVLFNADQHWAAYARSHFFRAPADVVRSVDLGGHGSTAGVVRRFAALLAHRDLSRAAALMRSIADPAERAIGFAELHRAAHGPDRSDSHHGPDADIFSREIDRALSELPRYRWTVGVPEVRGTVGDKYALAYVRPDHRVRFELAVRALGCREQDMRGLEGVAYLRHAFGRSMAMWVSAVYANDMIAGERPYPDFTELHLQNLSPTQDLNLKEIDAPTKSGLATTAYQEHRIAREVPGYRAKASRIRFDDPVYDAAMDLVTPAPGAPLSSGFTGRIRKLLVDGPVPAAADLLVFAAEARPEHERELRELAEELVETADDGSTLGVDALSTLATSPLLGDLVDPVDILREADRCVSRWPGEEWIPRYVVFRLFPVLLERAPRDALHKFYEVTSTGWSSAMALLEHAPDTVIDALGADAAATLGSAIARGLACTSPTGTAPDVVDGVRLARLVATGPADRRQAP